MSIRSFDPKYFKPEPYTGSQLRHKPGKKPHIWYSPGLQMWSCEGGIAERHIGLGHSMQQAYSEWRKQ